MSDLKLVFAGTPAFAASHLQALIDAGHEIAAVYTQPDRAAGRGKKLQASPVKQLAEKHGLPVFQPPSLKDSEEQRKLAELDADLMIVVAYGLILPQAVLDTPRLGCINVHASLLPRWRGAAPIERAILAGDSQTGITIMQMDVGLDTGDMLYTLKTPIKPDDDRVSLEQRLATLGQQALLHCLQSSQSFSELAAHAQKQDDNLSTYARKLDKAEALIDWQASSEQINRCIRAGIGRHPAFTFLGTERIRFLKATCCPDTSPATPGTIISHDKNSQGQAFITIACSDGTLQLESLQLAGKNPMPVGEVLNARRAMFAIGEQFTSQTPDPA
ncbi:Methionyl-tRNA formyltransferase [Pseudohongiella spirulinae]|uniref:Methionyl-tRNA formyltransferase n=2 Tax=Pseudohongiella spirulinae TaxID=1249552 RepID=A0A0S2K8M5_9GAMM|nr:Methionyl-tRNA formyltransferase [Pseudohongiella spirulinae]